MVSEDLSLINEEEKVGVYMKRRILKIVGIVLLVLVVFVVYMVAGGIIAYRRQPVVQEATKQKFNPASVYKASKQPERAAIIEENDKALTERVRMISQAKEKIVLSTYAFHSDRSGKVMLGALQAAAERKVKIQILVDGVESWTAMEGNKYFYALSSLENVEIKVYNRVNPLVPWKSMGRMHDKYLIADNNLYMLGGRNTYDYFLGNYPGHKNFDRDVLVYCENPDEDSSISVLKNYFQNIWEYKECRLFHDSSKLSDKTSVKKAGEELRQTYEAYAAKYEEAIADADYKTDTVEVEKITLLSNPITYEAKEPVVWYQLCELMKGAKEKVKIHTPYIICNEMMYEGLEEVVERVPEVSVMTNSVTNNGNPFGAGDYAANRDRIMDTGVNIWEYEGGYSYHGKSVLIDDDISIIGSFNMDMRSVYLDTELMLVIHSESINRDLNENMEAYEQSSRQYLEDGSYHNPYKVKPIPMKKSHERRISAVQKLLGWARFLF